MNKCHRYGRHCWRVVIDSGLSGDGEIYVYAGRISTSSSGDLILDTPGKRRLIMIAKGQWKAAYAISGLASILPAVRGEKNTAKHWKDGVIEDPPEPLEGLDDPIEKKKDKNPIANHTNERSKMTQTLRLDVMERDEFRCQLCGRENGDGISLEVDHIIPVTKGGKTELDNLQTLCADCNSGKKDRIIKGGHND